MPWKFSVDLLYKGQSLNYTLIDRKGIDMSYFSNLMKPFSQVWAYQHDPQTKRNNNESLFTPNRPHNKRFKLISRYFLKYFAVIKMKQAIGLLKDLCIYGNEERGIFFKTADYLITYEKIALNAFWSHNFCIFCTFLIKQIVVIDR